MRFSSSLPKALVTLAFLGFDHLCVAQGVRVSLLVKLNPPAGTNRGAMANAGNRDQVVAWLTPRHLVPASISGPATPAHDYVLTQQNKVFSPHLLVIPVGSSVQFPNLDPFFHNVFSLYNGRRFDLGLYEAGSRRSVRFDQEGVSYIFCNIHPEMGAVIVSLSTPYYAISAPDGSIQINAVPPGDYEVNLWSESVAADQSAAARRQIHVGTDSVRLQAIDLPRMTSLQTRHLNKFGNEYRKPDQTPY